MTRCVLVVCLSLLLAGCASLEAPFDLAWPDWWPFQVQRNVTEAPPFSPPVPSEPRPLRVLSWPVSPEEEAFLRDRLNDYQARRPDLPLALEFSADYERRLLDPGPDDAPPDLFLVTGFALPTYIAENVLAPVPAQYSQVEAIIPALLPGFGVGGTAFCLPRDVHTLALAYNPALFDRAETPYPSDAWSWAELAATADAVTDQNFFLFGVVLNPDLSRVAPFILQAGGHWIDPALGQLALTQPTAQAGIAYYVELYRNGSAVFDTTLDSTWPGEALGRGSAGMTIEGSWLLPFLAQDFPRFEYATAELPAGPAGKATLAFTTCLGVHANSPLREEAYALAAYLTQPDILPEWRAFSGSMPVRADELAAWQAVDPLRRPFAAGVAYAHVWQFPIGMQDIPDAATPLLRSTIAGDLTVETLVERLQAAATLGGTTPPAN